MYISQFLFAVVTNFSACATTILVMAPEIQEEILFSGNKTIYASDWCHDILVMAPEMQEESLYKFILMFMSVS